MDILEPVRLVLARWKIALAVTIAVGLLAFCYALSRTPSYSAVAQVIINVRTPDSVPVGSTEQSAPADQLSSDYLATQVDVLKSDRVALAAVELLGLTNSPGAMAEYRQAGSPAGGAANYFADELRRHLKLTPSPGSRVVSIAFKSKSPAAAALVANAFATAYRQVNLDLQVDPARQAATWYDQRASELRDQLTRSQADLDARRATLGVASDQDQTDAEVQRWNALSAQLASAQALQSSTNVRTSSGALPDAMASPVVQKIQSDLAAAEAQKRALSVTAGPNNPDYLQITRQIDELNRQLITQEQLVARSVSASAAQSTQSVGKLAADTQTEKGRVIANHAARDAVDALQQEVESLKLIYNQVVAKRAQANMIGADVQTNVSVLSFAVQPTKPAGLSALSPTTMTIVGLILGSILGSVVAFGLELLDQRIRRGADAEVWLGITNLGEIRVNRASRAIPVGSSFKRYLPNFSGSTR